MIAVIFEVVPQPSRQQEYLDAAAQLRPQLEAMDGFVSIERFASLTQSGKMLSLSFWRDEAAVLAWRISPLHRHFQAQGRAGLFDDYRLRVAAMMRDYGLVERADAPDDSRQAHR
ncbi:MAG: antibiotic biosynthesis monooxygenase [Massilia sp.]|nr:antibiotic biosynthesis monooxygenase [Massilia sp.]